jgi:hypothetical protein
MAAIYTLTIYVYSSKLSVPGSTIKHTLVVFFQKAKSAYWCQLVFFFRLPLFEKSTTHYEQKESSITSTRIYNLHTKEYNKTNTKLFAEATPAEIQHLSKGWSGRRSPIAVDPGLCPGGRCPAASASLMQRHRPVSA